MRQVVLPRYPKMVMVIAVNERKKLLQPLFMFPHPQQKRLTRVRMLSLHLLIIIPKK